MNRPLHQSKCRQSIRWRSESCGFSLLELLAVITLIGILVTIGITRIAESADAAKVKSCNHNRTQINAALERYAITTGALATAVSDVDTDDYFPGSILGAISLIVPISIN